MPTAFARNHQVMLNVVDGKRIDVEIDGAPLDLATGTLLGHRRWLDLRTGRLERRLRWRAPSGAVIEVRSRGWSRSRDPRWRRSS